MNSRSRTSLISARTQTTLCSRTSASSLRSEASKLESWHLWHFNPALIEENKNPFSLDSKEPQWEKFHDFLLGEVRYLSVKKAYPNEAEELFAEAQKMAQIRYKSYVRKTQENWED